MDKSGFKCVSSGFMLISGVGLCVAAFCVEPVGEIHDSVLWYFAQCLIYAGSPDFGGFNISEGVTHLKPR